MFTVYRMLEGQEENEDLWVELGSVSLPDTTFTETGLMIYHPVYIVLQ